MLKRYNVNQRTRPNRRARVPPPPVLAGFRSIEFAVIKRPIAYAGRSGLFVGPIDGIAIEIGPVPRLAIGQALRVKREFALLHCSRTWEVVGVQGAYETVAQVKQHAERIYPRVSEFWTPTHVTMREAKQFQHAIWNRLKCHFCGRIPPEQDTTEHVISSRTANICGKCIRDFYEAIQNHGSEKDG